MSDEHLPTIDIHFLKSLFEGHDKVEASINIGNTTAYLLKGKRPVFKRTVYIAELKSGQVDFDCATALVLHIGCMGELLKWLEANRKWKDGGYFQANSY